MRRAGRLARRVLPWVLVSAGAAWALRGLDPERLLSVFRSADLFLLACAGLVNLAAMALQGLRWHAVLRALGSVRYRDSAESLVVGFALSAVLPARLGELARIDLAAGRTGLRREAVAGATVLDHLVNALALGPLAATILVLPGVPGWIRTGTGIVLALAAGAAAMAWAVALPPEAAERGGWLRQRLSRLRTGFGALREPALLGRSMAAAAIAWVAEAAVAWLTAAAFGARLSAIGAMVPVLAVNLALAVPAAPANLGTFEAAAAIAAAAAGVPHERAVAFAISYHAVHLIVVWLAALPLRRMAAAGA